MYTVNATVVVAGSATDMVSHRIGVRTAIWTADRGLLINGLKVPAKGFSNHQDFAGCGQEEKKNKNKNKN